MIQNNPAFTLIIPNRSYKSILDISDISHLRASSNYTYIHHVKKTFLSSKTLRHYHEKLMDKSFIRTHQSYSVNLAYIDSIDIRNSMILLKNGAKVPIARSRKRFIKELFKRSQK